MVWLRDIDRWFASNIFPYEKQYLSLALRLTGNIESARDLVHDAYAQVLTHKHWKDILHPRTYIMKTTYNLGVERIRRARVVHIQQIADVETVSEADLHPDAFDTLASREELANVFAAIERLPPQCAKVIIMRRIKDMPPREIARELGLSLSTVEKHLARGLLILTDALSAPGDGSSRPEPRRVRSDKEGKA